MDKQVRPGTEKVDESKRWFLKGAGAVGILAFTPSRLKAALGYEKLALREQDLDFFQRICSNRAEHKHFQEQPTKEKVHSMIRVLAREDTKDTRDLERSSSFPAGSWFLEDERGAFIGDATILEISDARPGRATGAHRYILVTARHVAEKAKEGKWTMHPKGYDIAVCDMSAEQATLKDASKPSALPFDVTPQASKDISGESGIVIAYNMRTKKYQRKSYPSLISPRLSLKIFEALGLQPKVEKSSEFRMIVLPRGESRLDMNKDAPALGTSGGALLGKKKGSEDIEYKGLLISVVEKTIDGVEVSLASVLDDSLVRETILTHVETRYKFLQSKN